MRLAKYYFTVDKIFHNLSLQTWNKLSVVSVLHWSWLTMACPHPSLGCLSHDWQFRMREAIVLGALESILKAHPIQPLPRNITCDTGRQSTGFAQ